MRRRRGRNGGTGGTEEKKIEVIKNNNKLTIEHDETDLGVIL